MEFHVDFEHEGVEVNTSFLDVLVLNGVVEQVHQVGLAAARTSPDINALWSSIGLELDRSGCVVNDGEVGACVFDRSFRLC